MMSLREHTSNNPTRIALAVVAVAVLLCAYTTRQALRVVDVAAAPATVSVVAGALDTPTPQPSVSVGVAIDADLFAPERKPPAARYRMPGEAAPKTVEEPPKPVVLGVALAADGSSFAPMQFVLASTLPARSA